MTTEPDECYSLAQAAAILQVDPRTCVKLIEDKKLAATKLDIGRYGQWRVSRASTHALLPEIERKRYTPDNI